MCIKLQRVKNTAIQSRREKCVFCTIFFSSNNLDLFQATCPIILKKYSKSEHIEGSSEKVNRIFFSNKNLVVINIVDCSGGVQKIHFHSLNKIFGCKLTLRDYKLSSLSSGALYNQRNFLNTNCSINGQWPTKAKSRSHLVMLKINKLRHSYLNAKKLDNYGPKGECLNNNHQTSQKLYFYVFHNNFKDTKGTKMADPILESSLKTR